MQQDDGHVDQQVGGDDLSGRHGRGLEPAQHAQLAHGQHQRRAGDETEGQGVEDQHAGQYPVDEVKVGRCAGYIGREHRAVEDKHQHREQQVPEENGAVAQVDEGEGAGEGGESVHL